MEYWYYTLMLANIIFKNVNAAAREDDNFMTELAHSHPFSLASVPRVDSRIKSLRN